MAVFSILSIITAAEKNIPCGDVYCNIATHIYWNNGRKHYIFELLASFDMNLNFIVPELDCCKCIVRERLWELDIPYHSLIFYCRRRYRYIYQVCDEQKKRTQTYSRSVQTTRQKRSACSIVLGLFILIAAGRAVVASLISPAGIRRALAFLLQSRFFAPAWLGSS